MIDLEGYLLKNRGVPAAFSLVGSPHAGQPVVGHSTGPHQTAWFTEEEHAGRSHILPVYYELIAENLNEPLLNHYEGYHLLGRVYWFLSNNVPQRAHHFSYGGEGQEVATYFSSVYRKWEDIDELTELHSIQRDPVIDTPWRLEYVQREPLDPNQEPPLVVPQGYWYLYTIRFETVDPENIKTLIDNVWIHSSYPQESTSRYFSSMEENTFVPWMTDNPFIPNLTIRPFLP